MEYTITERVSVIGCNTCMIPVGSAHTSEYIQYQIETYRTNKHPWEIHAINNYNGKFSYHVGANVDILNHVVADPRYTGSPVFKNIINDDFLRRYIAQQRRQPR